MENAVTHNQDIIMFGLQPWDTPIGSNFKNMAVEMAKHNRILYVNRPLDRITAWKNPKASIIRTRKESIQKGIGVLEQVKNNLWVQNPATMLESINWMPPGFFYNYLNKRNNKKLADQIKWASGQLNFKSPTLIIDNDFFNALYLKEYLKVDCMVYYIRDYLLSQPYFLKHGIASEPAIMAKADIVAANSIYLTSYAKKYNQNAFYIGQGCDVDDFLNAPANFPQDISAIKKPVIGYCGALISSRLDIDLLISIAEQKTGWNIVLIGPEDIDFKKSKLHTLKNVYFLGGKPATELPAYIHYFDICINPQLVNQMTIGNYPRKVDEYLAAGKPVVATVTETMQEFSGCTYLCKDAREYINAIETILKDPIDENLINERIRVAKSHTWEAAVSKLYNSINECKSKITSNAGTR
jgi:teichuronic acid biosynthesis glycosyltransferase TuaH